jgi:hypothetical protein
LRGKRLEDVHMTGPAINGISPFFIVQDTPEALSFYRDRHIHSFPVDERQTAR